MLPILGLPELRDDSAACWQWMELADSMTCRGRARRKRSGSIES